PRDRTHRDLYRPTVAGGRVCVVGCRAVLEFPTDTERGIDMTAQQYTQLELALVVVGVLMTFVPSYSRLRLAHISAVTRLGGVGGVVGWIRRLLPARVRGMLRRHDDVDPLRLAFSWELLAAGLRMGMPVPLAVRVAAEGAPGKVRTILLGAADRLALGADPADAWGMVSEHQETAQLGRIATRTARSGAAFAAAVTELAEEVRSTASDNARA